MNIDINGARYIDSNRRNWFVRDGTKVDKKDNVFMLSCFNSLRTALELLADGKYGRVHEDDLAGLRRIVKELDDGYAEIERVFATPLKLRELKPLKIAFECAGFRFVVLDRWNVGRQERRPKGRAWQNKNYYPSLRQALADSLIESARLSETGGLTATIAVIRALRAEIMAAKGHLPAAYWGDSSAGPTTPLKPLLKTAANALAGRLHAARPAGG